MAKYGKIIRIEVQNSINRLYEVGQPEYCSKRMVSEIKDTSVEYEDSIFTAYEIIDKDGNCITRIENAACSIWYDVPDNKKALNNG